MKYLIMETINKEDIKFLKFPKKEVLGSKEQQKIRRYRLRRALSLGNLEHEKVGILFRDNEGVKKVETTVWGITDKSVILKQSTVIPLKRILQVN